MGTEYREHPSKAQIERHLGPWALQGNGFKYRWFKFENGELKARHTDDLKEPINERYWEPNPSHYQDKMRPIDANGTFIDWDTLLPAQTAAVEDYRQRPDDATLCKRKYWRNSAFPSRMYMFDNAPSTRFDYSDSNTGAKLGSAGCFDAGNLKTEHFTKGKWQPCTKEGKLLPWGDGLAVGDVVVTHRFASQAVGVQWTPSHDRRCGMVGKIVYVAADHCVVEIRGCRLSWPTDALFKVGTFSASLEEAVADNLDAFALMYYGLHRTDTETDETLRQRCREKSVSGGGGGGVLLMTAKYTEEGETMANSPTTTTEPKKPSRVRKAFEEAQRRVPVEWSLDEAHELLVKWAGSTVKVKAHRGIVQDWLREQLSTAYGKAALGALLASPIGVPLLAHVVGKGDALADKIADEFAARAMTIGGVQLARDVVRKLPKGLYNFALGLFDRFENTEMPQLTAQASRGGMEDIEKAAQTQAMRNG